MSKDEVLSKLRPEDVEANLALLSEYGVRCSHWNTARQPGGLVRLKRAAQALKGWRYADSISWQEARGIMKRNQFFGPAEWRKFFGIKLSKKQRAQIEEFPWSMEALQHRYSDAQYDGGEFMYPMDHEHYFAFLGMSHWLDGEPLTIRKWYQILQQRLEKGASGPVLDGRHSPYAGWLDAKDEVSAEDESCRQFLTETTPTFGWYLMRIKDVRGGWMTEDQYAPTELVMADHRTATAIERIIMHSCYYLRNDVYVEQDGDDYHGGLCSDAPRKPGISGRSLLPHPEVKPWKDRIHLGSDSFFEYHLDTRHYPLTRIPGH